MYISSIEIKNFRNFKNNTINFNDGVNVIIGHNNAGKTNLIKALSLILDNNNSKRLDVDDFNKHVELSDLKVSAPKIIVSIIIKKGSNEDPDDLVTVSEWLTKLDESYEARLTYEFFLPENKAIDYTSAMSEITDKDSLWKVLRHDFIRFYKYKIWGGDLINRSTADPESLQKFDFQFLDAIRDVERDMFSGKHTLLRDIFDFFMDYDVKIDSQKNNEEKQQEIKKRKNIFSVKADELLGQLNNRLNKGKGQILNYANQTGASSFNNAKPDFDGSISDVEMYSVLKLIVEENTGTGIKIPASHNGLGYNNLIFMSLLLAKMQVDSDSDYLDSNAKVFSMLAIEEPEAHLHPSMQYKFLKFLKENHQKNKVRQIFVTTHSTHITSAGSLDEIICLNNDGNILSVGYPRLALQDSPQSKKYVQRFLDATKSDMLFAKKILFVEGIAEQLLIPIMAKCLGKSLEDNHVAIINVGGRHFQHFLHLFDDKKDHTIHKQVVCLTDVDQSRKEKIKGSKFVSCYPYEYEMDKDNYEYKINQCPDKYLEGENSNITFFTQNQQKSKTFEYEIILNNPSSKLLLTESISNSKEIEKLMDYYSKHKPVDDFLNELRDSDENKRIKSGIESAISLVFDDTDKKKAIIASRYLNSVGKGENALELSIALQENLDKKGTNDYEEFIVPEYIEDAINKLCL